MGRGGSWGEESVKGSCQETCDGGKSTREVNWGAAVWDWAGRGRANTDAQPSAPKGWNAGESYSPKPLMCHRNTLGFVLWSPSVTHRGMFYTGQELCKPRISVTGSPGMGLLWEAPSLPHSELVWDLPSLCKLGVLCWLMTPKAKLPVAQTAAEQALECFRLQDLGESWQFYPRVVQPLVSFQTVKSALVSTTLCFQGLQWGIWAVWLHGIAVLVPQWSLEAGFFLPVSLLLSYCALAVALKIWGFSCGDVAFGQRTHAGLDSGLSVHALTKLDVLTCSSCLSSVSLSPHSNPECLRNKAVHFHTAPFCSLFLGMVSGQTNLSHTCLFWPFPTTPECEGAVRAEGSLHWCG